jgi:lactate dehydrogenase-like 2-hydroxyacid dehydrogenase
MKAFIFDPLWSQLITPELLRDLSNAGVTPIVTQQIAPIAECTELFRGNDARIIAINPDYVSWKLSSDDYREIPNLKGIFGAATSCAWIDRAYADAHDIPVCDIRNFSTEAVAEWAITMMCNLARQVPRLIKDGFPLDFDRDFMKYRGVELHGKTAGIIGLGNIGNAIAKRCAGLGMKVMYWSRNAKNVPYNRADLENIFSCADVIFPTLADNEQTRDLIAPQMLHSVKSSALLVSVVHGIVDEKLVLDMVQKGKLFGFGFEAKPASFSRYEGNIWAAPAYAWVTDESMSNSMKKWVQNMIDASQGKFPTRVN